MDRDTDIGKIPRNFRGTDWNDAKGFQRLQHPEARRSKEGPSPRAFRGSRALLTPLSWISGLWNSERIHVCSSKSCPWWYVVTATLGNY